MLKIRFKVLITFLHTQMQCQYIFTKGANSGTQCQTNTKSGNFCSICAKKKGIQPVSPTSIIINARLEQLTQSIMNLSIETGDLIVDNDNLDINRSNMHSSMVQRIVAKKVLDIGKIMYSDAGRELEVSGPEVGINLDILPGQSSEIYSDGIFSFKKKLTNESDHVDWTMFQIELLRLGVSSDILREAHLNSTVKRQPTKYIEVNII